MSEAKGGVRARIAEVLGTQAGARVGVSYVLRTTCAAVASLLASRALHIDNPIWAVVSSVVVILPTLDASVSTAALRVVANLVGAAVGAAIAAFGLPMLPSLVLGLAAVALGCRVLRIDSAARTACVAVTIVLLRDPHEVFGSSEARVALVMLGCGIALAVTVAAAQIERMVKRLSARPAAK